MPRTIFRGKTDTFNYLRATNQYIVLPSIPDPFFRPFFGDDINLDKIYFSPNSNIYVKAYRVSIIGLPGAMISRNIDESFVASDFPIEFGGEVQTLLTPNFEEWVQYDKLFKTPGKIQFWDNVANRIILNIDGTNVQDAYEGIEVYAAIDLDVIYSGVLSATL